MRLLTFRVRNCFGFRDSGDIDLSYPGNLVYILGTNSSGKTALLTAIEALSLRQPPKDSPRFENFDPTNEEPALIAQFDKGNFVGVQASAGTGFSVQHLVADMSKALAQMNNHIPNVGNSQEFEKLTSAIRAVVTNVYTPVFSALEVAGITWVKRDSVGDYFFSADPLFADERQRRATLRDGIIRAFSQSGGGMQGVERRLQIGGGNYNLNLITEQQVENLMWQRFPRIARFDQRETLSENLPDGITQAHLNTGSPLLAAFLKILGLDKVRKAITTHNPIIRDTIVAEMQTQIDQVIAEVNEIERSFGRGNLLTIRLSMFNNSLQIAVKTGIDRYSYYRHISENTKMLFAYYLLMLAKQITANILLFDEPNNGFHATAQEELLRFFKMLAAEGRQMIVSTHSEHLIDLDHLAGVRRMVTDEQGNYLGVRNKWNAPTKSDGDILALRPVMDAIGLRFGSSPLTFQNHLIVTEGPSELYYLRSFRQIFGGDELHLTPAANGDDAVRPVVALLIGQGLKFKVVLDTTTHGKSAKERLQEAYGIPDDYIYEVAIPKGPPTATGSGIEDIFSHSDFEKLLIASGNPPGAELTNMTNGDYMNSKKLVHVPKLLLARWFSGNVSVYPPESFDPATQANIRSLLAFCGNSDWFSM